MFYLWESYQAFRFFCGFLHITYFLSHQTAIKVKDRENSARDRSNPGRTAAAASEPVWVPGIRQKPSWAENNGLMALCGLRIFPDFPAVIICIKKGILMINQTSESPLQPGTSPELNTCLTVQHLARRLILNIRLSFFDKSIENNQNRNRADDLEHRERETQD